jgi:hypothetical protein
MGGSRGFKEAREQKRQEKGKAREEAQEARKEAPRNRGAPEEAGSQTGRDRARAQAEAACETRRGAQCAETGEEARAEGRAGPQEDREEGQEGRAGSTAQIQVGAQIEARTTRSFGGRCHESASVHVHDALVAGTIAGRCLPPVKHGVGMTRGLPSSFRSACSRRSAACFVWSSAWNRATRHWHRSAANSDGRSFLLIDLAMCAAGLYATRHVDPRTDSLAVRRADPPRPVPGGTARLH